MSDTINVTCEREIKKLEKRHGRGIVNRIEKELARGDLDDIASSLGEGNYKMRVALPGQGKSGGMRALIHYDGPDEVTLYEVYQRKER